MTLSRALEAQTRLMETLAKRRNLLQRIPDLGPLSPLLTALAYLPGMLAEIMEIPGPSGAQQCIAVLHPVSVADSSSGLEGRVAQILCRERKAKVRR